MVTALSDSTLPWAREYGVKVDNTAMTRAIAALDLEQSLALAYKIQCWLGLLEGIQQPT